MVLSEPSPCGQRGPCACSRPSLRLLVREDLAPAPARVALALWAARHRTAASSPSLGLASEDRGPLNAWGTRGGGALGQKTTDENRREFPCGVAGESGAATLGLTFASRARAARVTLAWSGRRFRARASRRRSSCCDHDRKNKTGRLNSVNSKTSWARQQSPASFPTSIKTVVCQSRAISVSLRSQSGRKWALRGIGWLPMCYGDFETHPTSLLVHETVQS